MDLNSIVALAQAGFTREQIYQLANAPTAQQPQIVPQPQQMPQQMPAPMMVPQQMPAPMMVPQQMPQMYPQMQPAPAPTPAPAPAPTEENKPDPFMMLFEQMTGIKKAIQDSNIQNSQITGAEPQSTDDILASIIQPTKPKEDK